MRSAGTESCGVSLDESLHQAGWMGGRERSGSARAGKRTWGWRRVRRIGYCCSPSCGMWTLICRDLHTWVWSVGRARALAGRPRRAPRSRHTFVGRKDWRKTFSDSKEGYRPRPARRAISLVPLPYPRAQCGYMSPTAAVQLYTALRVSRSHYQKLTRGCAAARCTLRHTAWLAHAQSG